MGCHEFEIVLGQAKNGFSAPVSFSLDFGNPFDSKLSLGTNKVSFWMSVLTYLAVFCECPNVVLDLKVGMLACNIFFPLGRLQVSLLLAFTGLDHSYTVYVRLLPNFLDLSFFYPSSRQLTNRSCLPFY